MGPSRRADFADHCPGDRAWEELGIFEHITRPRIEAAITGRTPEGQQIKGEYRFLDEFPMLDGLDENVHVHDSAGTDSSGTNRSGNRRSFVSKRCLAEWCGADRRHGFGAAAPQC